MWKRVLWAAVTAVLIAFGGQALAAPLTTVGQKNFMRGRIAEKRLAPDEAKAYFQRSAEAYSQYIARKDAAGEDVFASDLTLAGMVQYKAGMYAQAASTMARVRKARPETPEAWVYGGLAEARMGRREEALRLWQGYPVSAGQVYVADALKTQGAAVQDGRTGLDQAAQAVDEALLRQDVWNTHLGVDSNPAYPDRCDGQYWWRTADMPCQSPPDPDNP